MPSTGKIRWHLWAPLALLALVSGVPSKAQDQGKCSPPPCSSLFCLRPSSYATLSPGDLLSVSPDLYPSSPSSPLLASPHFCLLFPHRLAVWCADSPPSLHKRIPTIPPKSFAGLHTCQRGVMNAPLTVVHQTVIVPPMHKGSPQALLWHFDSAKLI